MVRKKDELPKKSFFEHIKEKKLINDMIGYDVDERAIIFDGKQYSCKMPKDFMQQAGYKKGDIIRFILISDPIEGKSELRLEYVRK